MPLDELTIIGQTGAAIDVPADDVRSVKVYVRLPPGAVRTASTDFAFVLTDAAAAAGTASVRYDTVFRGPE